MDPIGFSVFPFVVETETEREGKKKKNKGKLRKAPLLMVTFHWISIRDIFFTWYLCE